MSQWILMDMHRSLHAGCKTIGRSGTVHPTEERCGRALGQNESPWRVWGQQQQQHQQQQQQQRRWWWRRRRRRRRSRDNPHPQLPHHLLPLRPGEPAQQVLLVFRFISTARPHILTKLVKPQQKSGACRSGVGVLSLAFYNLQPKVGL